MKARKTYQQPKVWSDVQRLVTQMRVDMLRAAGEGACDATFAANKLGMSRNAYVTNCRRLGVPVDHLIETDHPRWSGKR